MKLAQGELTAMGAGMTAKGQLAEDEIALAGLYLERHDLASAARELDAANQHMEGEKNTTHRRWYAVARGELELAQGRPQTAEPLLHESIIEAERLAGKSGVDSIVLAQQDRDLYAILAGIWLAQGRPSQQILALWERYRLRILGNPVPVCPQKALDCLQPKLSTALKQLDSDTVLGQIVLLDRLLLYRVTAQGVAFSSVSLRKADLLAASAELEHAVSSSATTMASVDRSARYVGQLLIDPVLQLNPASQSDSALRPNLALQPVSRVQSALSNKSASTSQASTRAAQLLLEGDPLLGNLPWPAVETAGGPIGLHFNLEELPSLVLDRSVNRSLERAGSFAADRPGKPMTGKPLIVGASISSPAASDGQPLPEVLAEARAVARFAGVSNLLLADQATEPQVAARLATASAIHFAGHASQQDGETRLLLAEATPVANSATAQDKPYLDSELLRKRPPRAAQLMVFSACSTGKKEEGWNHGMGDIVDTLASIGVPDVVATRWQIDSASAVPLMDDFYAGLASGLTVPQALTVARQSLVRDSRYRHPYYWAAWYASGRGRSSLSQVFHASR
jgi:CHAT domain-containing protein